MQNNNSSFGLVILLIFEESHQVSSEFLCAGVIPPRNCPKHLALLVFLHIICSCSLQTFNVIQHSRIHRKSTQEGVGQNFMWISACSVTVCLILHNLFNLLKPLFLISQIWNKNNDLRVLLWGQDESIHILVTGTALIKPTSLIEVRTLQIKIRVPSPLRVKYHVLECWKARRIEVHLNIFMFHMFIHTCILYKEILSATLQDIFT